MIDRQPSQTDRASTGHASRIPIRAEQASTDSAATNRLDGGVSSRLPIARAVSAACAASLLMLPTGGCHLLWGDFETTEEARPDRVCTEGTFACGEDGTLQECRDATWAFLEVCEEPDWCRQDEGRCLVCKPGTRRCDPHRLLQCSDAGDAWVPVLECPAPLVCDEMSASCATCSAGAARCTSDGLALETCNTSASGWTLDNCGAGGCADEPNDCDYCSNCAPDGHWVCSPCGKVLYCEGSQWRVTVDCGRVEECVVDSTSGYCI